MATNPDCADHAPWLDEVRAQREVWEQQRDQIKREVETHQYFLVPWKPSRTGGTDLPTGINQEPPPELLYRTPRPWLNPGEPYSRREQRLQENEARRETHRQALDRQWEEHSGLLNPYPPFGWDNPWYYRGY